MISRSKLNGKSKKQLIDFIYYKESQIKDLDKSVESLKNKYIALVKQHSELLNNYYSVLDANKDLSDCFPKTIYICLFCASLILNIVLSILCF